MTEKGLHDWELACTIGGFPRIFQSCRGRERRARLEKGVHDWTNAGGFEGFCVVFN